MQAQVSSSRRTPGSLRSGFGRPLSVRLLPRSGLHPVPPGRCSSCSVVRRALSGRGRAAPNARPTPDGVQPTPLCGRVSLFGGFRRVGGCSVDARDKRLLALSAPIISHPAGASTPRWPVLKRTAGPLAQVIPCCTCRPRRRRAVLHVSSAPPSCCAAPDIRAAVIPANAGIPAPDGRPDRSRAPDPAWSSHRCAAGAGWARRVRCMPIPDECRPDRFSGDSSGAGRAVVGPVEG